MRALIVADSRPDAGNGHVVRSQALAAELEAHGWDVELIGPTGCFVGAQDVTVFDLRPDVRTWVGAKRCVQIVDDVDVVPECDLLVNGSAGASPDLYARAGHCGRVLAGPAYALLRSDFAAARNCPRVRKGIIDLRVLSTWNAADLALDISSAQVAITYAGMRAMECACLGTPMLLIPRPHSVGEPMNIRGFVEASACIVADAEDAADMAQTMLECPRLLQKMGENARELVDGKGCKRVAQAIGELVG